MREMYGRARDNHRGDTHIQDNQYNLCSWHLTEDPRKIGKEIIEVENRIMRRNLEEAEKIIHYYWQEIKDTPCSYGHHFNRRGGLEEHQQNVVSIAIKYFPKDNRLQFLARVHDIGKSQVYDIDENEKISYKSPSVDHFIATVSMLESVDVGLDDEELNAIQFHHGGWSPFKGQMTELAVKLHFCDLLATVREK